MCLFLTCFPILDFIWHPNTTDLLEGSTTGAAYWTGSVHSPEAPDPTLSGVKLELFVSISCFVHGHGFVNAILVIKHFLLNGCRVVVIFIQEEFQKFENTQLFPYRKLLNVHGILEIIRNRFCTNIRFLLMRNRGIQIENGRSSLLINVLRLAARLPLQYSIIGF